MISSIDELQFKKKEKFVKFLSQIRTNVGNVKLFAKDADMAYTIVCNKPDGSRVYSCDFKAHDDAEAVDLLIRHCAPSETEN